MAAKIAILSFFSCLIAATLVQASGNAPDIQICMPCGTYIPGKCAEGLVCVAFGKMSKCVKKVAAGGSCKNSCHVCEGGLPCQNEICTKPAVACGAQCGGSYGENCAAGSSCTDIPGKGKYCTKAVDVNDKCDEKCTFCKSGLRCHSGVCTRPALACGAQCGGSYGENCAAGSSCTDIPGKGKYCTKVVDVNDKCDEKCSFCKKGLSCKNGMCVRKTAGCGSPCGYGKPCDYGLHCIRKGYKNMCVKYVGNHESCGGCVKCSHGYICNHYSKKCFPAYGYKYKSRKH